jgi:PAS domain S-box-containing protein
LADTFLEYRLELNRGVPQRRTGASLMQVRLKDKVLRFALPPVLLVLAVPVAGLLESLLPHAAEYLFLAAVAAAAWLGGRWAGLIAAGAAPLVLDYYFLPPLHTFGLTPESRVYLLPFFLSALVVAWVSSADSSTRRARAALAQDETRFRGILINLPDVSWTADSKGKILYISPKVAAILGYSSEEIRAGGQQMLLDSTHPEDIERFRQAAQALFANQQPFDVEVRFRHKDGHWVWIHDRALGAYERNGHILADGVITDISCRKQAEIDLRTKTAFLEAQANSTIDGILVVDENGFRSLINRRLVELFHVPAAVLADPNDRLLLDHVTGLVKNPDEFLAVVLRVNGNRAEILHDEIEFRDGAIFDRYSAPVVGSDGAYYGRIWTFRDITLRRRDEDRLRQLSIVVEQSPNSILIADRKGRIRYVNPKFVKLTGYAPEEVIGKSPSLLKSGHTTPETYRDLWHTIQQGNEWRGEFCNKKKNGELFWESAVICPILDEANQIAHYVAIKEDITERRTLESELRQAQKLEGIGQLAAGIAHEINTPVQFLTDNLTFLGDAWKDILQLLDGYREAVRANRGKLPHALVEQLGQNELDCDIDFIHKEVPAALAQGLDGARRVAAIVRAMKEFSHPDSPDKTETDLNQAIRSTITVARNEWKYVAEVTTDLDPMLPPVICYPGEINQVILNLIVNAAHTIHDKTKGKEKGKIAIATRARGSSVEIAVSDTGMGIPEEIQTRIYEPFFTTKEVGKGTGQGLALAHSVVVKKHLGKIWFETQPGVGTTFYLQIPLGRPVAEAVTA